MLLPQEKSVCSINLTVSPYQLDALNTGSRDCLAWRTPIRTDYTRDDIGLFFKGAPVAVQDHLLSLVRNDMIELNNTNKT